MKNKLKLVTLILTGVLLVGCGNNQNESDLAKGLNCIVSQDYSGALGYLSKAEDNGENKEEIYRGMGLAYMGQGEYGKAVSFFRKALSNASMNPGTLEYDINYYMAVCYYKLGDYDSAVTTYDGILTMNPKDQRCYYLRGSMRLNMGDTEGAMADFDKALELKKNDYGMYLDVYEVMANKGYNDLAEKYLGVVLAADIDNMSDFDKGRLSYYQGQYAQAINYLERAKKDDSTNKDIIDLLSDCYKKNNQYDYAAVIYSTYLAETADPEVFNQLGICYVEQGDYASALSAFQSGINIKEGNTCMQTLMLNEVACYERLLDFGAAREKLSEYLTIYPGDANLQKELVFLNSR